jgi:hypothetical protein
MVAFTNKQKQILTDRAIHGSKFGVITSRPSERKGNLAADAECVKETS